MMDATNAINQASCCNGQSHFEPRGHRNRAYQTDGDCSKRERVANNVAEIESVSSSSVQHVVLLQRGRVERSVRGHEEVERGDGDESSRQLLCQCDPDCVGRSRGDASEVRRSY